MPASLRSSFERNQIDYQLDNQRTSSSSTSRWATKADDETSTGRKAKFGEQYLTRLGRSGFQGRGTDFSTQKTDDWEEVRLKRQLQELEAKMERVEAEVARRPGGGGSSGKRESRPALIKREFEQLLDYKRLALRKLEEGGDGKGGGGGGLKGVSDDLQTVREQVEGLESHLSTPTISLSLSTIGMNMPPLFTHSAKPTARLAGRSCCK